MKALPINPMTNESETSPPDEIDASEAGKRLIEQEVRDKQREQLSKELREKKIERFKNAPEIAFRKKFTAAVKRSPKVGPKDWRVFYLSFANLFNAGIRITDALRIVGDQSENSHLKKAAYDLEERVNGGSTLSAAMKAHPKIFDDFHCLTIRLGESTGKLSTILEELSNYEEKAYKIRSEFLSPFYYPAAMGVLLVAFLLLGPHHIAEPISQLFQSVGREVPLFLSVLFSISHFAYTPFILIPIVLFWPSVVAFKAFCKSSTGKRLGWSLGYKLPVIGPLLQKMAHIRFATSLALQLNAGQPLVPGVESALQLTGDPKFIRSSVDIIIDLEAGEDLVESLKSAGLFEDTFLAMCEVGAQSGKTEEMLRKASRFYTDNFEHEISVIHSMLEPLILLLFGGIAATFCLSLLSPLYTLIQAL